MSSVDGTATFPAAANSDDPRRYFCHQCERTSFISSSAGDLICPHCNSSFIEELEPPIPNPNPNPNPIPQQFSFTTDFPAAGFSFPLAFSGAGADSQQLGDLSALLSSPTQVASPLGEAFNPMSFVQHYLQNMRPGGVGVVGGGGGGNVQFIINNSDDLASQFRLPGNTNAGDYFFGPGLEDLIQQLAENDPSRRGPPPALRSAVEKLPVIEVSKELLESDASQCAVCKDTFVFGEKVRQMPCKHIYHDDCILPWLELHNSCPVCRFELPTDDPNYEQMARGGGGGSGGGGGGSFDDLFRTSFRMSLPLRRVSFASGSGSGSAAGTSNVGNVNNNSENNSDQFNTDNWGNPNFEPETRQEDLD